MSHALAVTATAAAALHVLQPAAANGLLGARVDHPGADQGWPQVCTTGGGYSSYNATACPSNATCCANGFSVSGMGCCPWQDAV
jgi:hypothetical protein